MIRTIAWQDDMVVLVDQKALPAQEAYVLCRDYTDVAAAIKDMTVRGAPAIGIAAAMGIALGFGRRRREAREDQRESLHRICDDFGATRPTAANLFRAIHRMKECFEASDDADFTIVAGRLKEEALRMLDEDIESNQWIGRFGRDLVPPGSTVLTHCNAGALATGGYGTALGVIRAAHEKGAIRRVFAGETRPLLQGARLTAWELAREGIPVTVITDSMAGHFMARKEIDLVIVGADRIAANGDTANKIGTYTLALLAREHDIPFYVAAPRTTIDAETATGDDIPIEERYPEEVLTMAGTPTAPAGTQALNPAFDVTPNRLITAIITDAGIIRQPFEAGIIEIFKS
ncbi:MAG: S-methyl-5-thioribose-1-phosphate isomerase [Syntrophales bacterium]|jgi:methylthioribose-1-phosphate isomerase|nr:S-methyl-5-thioribose-1-phosphate isomerase [Syntrophales bacterium]MCK9527088.1 S-methyl-5-thioribose-1-phosphate isomerase [Syntrophales bacterium]MDX9921787.1 S-methyl-5-thioribose-1-phosphate isomerase [Syntrophales bacterium]